MEILWMVINERNCVFLFIWGFLHVVRFFPCDKSLLPIIDKTWSPQQCQNLFLLQAWKEIFS